MASKSTEAHQLDRYNTQAPKKALKDEKGLIYDHWWYILVE